MAVSSKQFPSQKTNRSGSPERKVAPILAKHHNSFNEPSFRVLSFDYGLSVLVNKL